MLTRSVWSREGADELSRAVYIRAIAFFTLVVGLLVAVGAVMSYGWEMSWLLLIGTFVTAVVCIFLFQLSSNPVLSGAGVSGMSFALGLMIGPLVATYSSVVVMQAVVLTAATMVVMSTIGVMFPKVFEGIGPYLLAGLTLLIVAQFAQIIFIVLGFEQAMDMPILTWIGIGIFTLYVAYDWSRALSLPHTLDNAIDASGGLILDAVNLFIRFLDILDDD